MPDLHNDDLFNSICTKLASYGETSSEVIDLLYKQVWSVLSKVAPIRFASEEIDRLYNESGSFKDLFHISLFISFDIIYTYVSRLLNDLDVELGNYDLPYGFNKQIEKIADQQQFHLFLNTMPSGNIDEYFEQDDAPEIDEDEGFFDRDLPTDEMFLNICHNLTGFVYSELIKKINKYELAALLYLSAMGIDYSSSGLVISSELFEKIAKINDLQDHEWPDWYMFTNYFDEHPDEFEAFFEDNKDELIEQVINNCPFSLAHAQEFLENELNYIIL